MNPFPVDKFAQQRMNQQSGIPGVGEHSAAGTAPPSYSQAAPAGYPPSAPPAQYHGAHDPWSKGAGGAGTTSTTNQGYGAYADDFHQDDPHHLHHTDDPEVGLSSTEVNQYQNYYRNQTRNMRNMFIFRVYLILCSQLAMTILLTAAFLYVDSIKQWVQQANWMFWTVWVSSLVCLIVLFFVRNKSPVNAIMLIVWTLLESYLIAFITSFYEATAVLQAAILTAIVTVSVTVFCFWSKKDFSFMGGALFAVLCVLLLGLFIQLLFPMGSWFVYLYASIGAVLFTLYILYDTSLLIHRYPEDEYILPAISLYLDIVNLFLMILALFGGRRD